MGCGFLRSCDVAVVSDGSTFLHSGLTPVFPFSSDQALLSRQPSGRSVKELSQISPKRLIHWPVLTRPRMAGFGASTDGMAANRFEGSEISCDDHCKVTGLSCSGPLLGCRSQSAWWLANNRSQSVSRQTFSDRTNAMAQHSFKSFMYFSCSTYWIELTNARKNGAVRSYEALRRFLMSKWIIGTLQSSLKPLEKPINIFFRQVTS